MGAYAKRRLSEAIVFASGGPRGSLERSDGDPQSFTLKLTSMPKRRLSRGSRVQFDERDNQTPSRKDRYIFQDLNDHGLGYVLLR